MGCNTTKEVIPNETEERRPPDPETLVRISESPVIPYIDESAGEEEQNEAATKIQAAFRGHKTRKEMQKAKQAVDQNQPTREELEAEFSADDKELCHAATKIQASFRGHQSRKDTKTKPDVEELSEKMDQLQSKKEEEEEDLDIDLSDPELHKAATKIQASFRGHKTRKEPKQ